MNLKDSKGIYFQFQNAFLELFAAKLFRIYSKYPLQHIDFQVLYLSKISFFVYLDAFYLHGDFRYLLQPPAPFFEFAEFFSN